MIEASGPPRGTTVMREWLCLLATVLLFSGVLLFGLYLWAGGSGLMAMQAILGRKVVGGGQTMLEQHHAHVASRGRGPRVRDAADIPEGMSEDVVIS